MMLGEAVVVLCFKGKKDYVIPLGEYTREGIRVKILEIIDRKDIKHCNLTFFSKNDYFSSLDEISWHSSLFDFERQFKEDTK